MKKILLFLCLFISVSLSAQTVKIDSTSFTIKHGELTFYLDKDTASYVSVHSVKYKEMLKIDGIRSDKWHKEKPFGPYHKDAYVHSGYDLGHLTPSNITSYNDSLNYHSFSLFNQAPQIGGFNRGAWAQLEDRVEKLILASKKNAVIITGVLYDAPTQYLKGSRIKVPFVYYKILVFSDGTQKAWMGSNSNGMVTETDLKTILDIAKKNGNSLGIKISK